MKLLDNGNLELIEGSGVLYLQMYNGINGAKYRDISYINKEQLKSRIEMMKEFSTNTLYKTIKFGVSDKYGIYEITMDNGIIIGFECIKSV